MKKLIVLLVLITTVGFAQENIITKLGDFHTLKVYNGLTVELKKGATSKIEITGNKHYTRSYILGKLNLKQKDSTSYKSLIESVNNLSASSNSFFLKLLPIQSIILKVKWESSWFFTFNNCNFIIPIKFSIFEFPFNNAGILCR